MADPDNFLHVLMNSKAQTYYGLAYRNPEFDRLTDEARVSIDRGLREAAVPGRPRRSFGTTAWWSRCSTSGSTRWRTQPCRASGCTRRRLRCGLKRSGLPRSRVESSRGRTRGRTRGGDEGLLALGYGEAAASGVVTPAP